METKQVIVVRADLKMRRGKECAQAAHASGMFMREFICRDKPLDGAYPVGEEMPVLTNEQFDWLRGNYRKVVVRADSEKQLRDLHNAAQEAGLTAHFSIDDGLTEVPAGTITALAIGPDEESKIDKITKHLKLY